MNEFQSSTDILVINALKTELTVPTITPTYREAILARLASLEKENNSLQKRTLTYMSEYVKVYKMNKDYNT